MLSSCTKEKYGSYLDGSEKTPIEVTVIASTDGNSVGTKAADRDFANGDTFVAYLRHVTWDGNKANARTSVSADKAPLLVSFTKGEAAMEVFSGDDITPIGTNVALGLPSNSKKTSNLTATPTLYWDDISNTTQDIRAENHYLESFYGYCYNGSPASGQSGSSISTALVEGTGVLGWTVASDQNVTDAFQHSDLLWSAEQTPVSYIHAKESRKGLVIPFTHAMSKVTLVVVCDTDEGFEADATKNFGSAEVTLKGVNKTALLTAPTMTISGFAGNGTVKMQKVSTGATAVQNSFSALIAPTLLKAGNEFATINGIDGNNYTLYLSDAILNAKDGDVVKTNAWSKQLVNYESTSITPSTAAGYTSGNGGITRPGVHYIVTVTVKKQGITVEAILKDWDAVSAEGIGQIQFATDVKTIVTDPADLPQFTAAFDLYKTHTLPSNMDYGKKATTVIWNNETSKWECSPLIYWQNKDDSEYFRALSGAVADDEETPDNESLDMAAGRDVLWGTTATHSGETVNDSDYEYYEGSPIHPRTTYVPLIFRHIMSKITVNLVDDLAGSSDPGATLNLAGATIQFTNMANTGTIELHMGGITAGALSAKMLSEDGGSKRYGFYAANDETKTSEADKLVKLKDYVVVPQAFTDRVAPAEDAYIIITLADGTTYKLKLNTCQTLVTAATDETPAVYEDINKWERGKHYTYTISLAKEQITFRAMIKDWVEKTGSGNANLEWD